MAAEAVRIDQVELNRRRLEAGLSVRDLARRAGVSYSRARAAAAGRPIGLRVLCALAKALGVPVASLIDEGSLPQRVARAS